METYDIAVIGAGPAGLSAGITARARNKRTVILSNRPQDSPLAKAAHIDNYPGMPSVSGLTLLTTMLDQAKSLGCGLVEARAVTVLPFEGVNGASFSITTSNDYMESRSVILALGAHVGGKPIIGETDYLGRGVSYCANCDGMFFKNSTVCVVGLSPDALKEAEFLAGLGATVHYCVPKWPEEGNAPDNMQIHVGVAREILGAELGVTGLRLDISGDRRRKPGGGAESGGENTSERVIACQAVFVLRPSIAADTLLPTLELSSGSIKVDERMRTSVSGVFAAGDCTGKPLQIAKAVGEGQLACFSAVEYLDD